jgi:hypothetical protein
MSKGSVFRLLMGCCLLTFLAGAAVVSSTTLSRHQTTAGHASCRTTEVTLHGGAAPTVSCLDGQKGTVRTLPVGGRGPLTHLDSYLAGCDDDALLLFWDSNLGGTELCIKGYGYLNLNRDFNGLNWNDQTSSYWTGCYDDYFYVDVNQGGGIGWAPGSPDGDNSPWGNFPLGGVGNNQLSSLNQSQKYGGDDCP